MIYTNDELEKTISNLVKNSMDEGWHFTFNFNSRTHYFVDGVGIVLRVGLMRGDDTRYIYAEPTFYHTDEIEKKYIPAVELWIKDNNRPIHYDIFYILTPTEFKINKRIYTDDLHVAVCKYKELEPSCPIN